MCIRDSTYSIETDARGNHQVRASRPEGGAGHIVASFRTEAEARAWIDNQLQIKVRMATSSDIT